MGTSHHWYLKAQARWQGQGYLQVCVPQAHPMPTAHSPSPNGHEVEDVGHARAVAQEAADADLEHDGNHQDPVPAGGAGRDKDRPGGDGDQMDTRALGQRGSDSSCREMF